MNENNLEYLQSTLKYLGFGESLNDQLKESISKGSESFNLQSPTREMPDPAKRFEEGFGDKISYLLNFSRSKETDMYFFNSYEATLKKAESKDLISQKFYINKGKGVTAKESYNLLSGRAVNKDVVLKNGDRANLWLKLDFTDHSAEKGYAIASYSEQYGFDLRQTVDKFKIRGMGQPGFKDQLLKSLEKGNLHEVSFMKSGKEASGFVAANPQFKTLDFYNADLSQVYSKSVDRHEGPEKKEVANNGEMLSENAQVSQEKNGMAR